MKCKLINKLIIYLLRKYKLILNKIFKMINHLLLFLLKMDLRVMELILNEKLFIGIFMIFKMLKHYKRNLKKRKKLIPKENIKSNIW